METLTVSYEDKPIYDIVYSTAFDNLKVWLDKQNIRNRRVCIVSEANVASLYLDAILLCVKECSKQTTTFIFPEGEQSKNLDVVRDLYEHLIVNRFDRNDLLIALGGGVVGDLTGYAAATYLRGIDFVQIPTSLLAQVDSSIGGKTGVDFDSYKNMVGAFHMPKLVYINLTVLNTLSDRQFCSGMGEIIKHGIIKNSKYFYWLGENAAQINSRSIDVMKKMVYESNLVKKNVVEKDPTEKGERALLNFGHTLGHAIEKYMNFEFLHGECVLIGSILATMISYNKGLINKDDRDLIISTIKAYNPPILPSDTDIDMIIDYTKNDKKAVGDKIKFILLRAIGDAYIDMNVTDDDMRKALEELIGERM